MFRLVKISASMGDDTVIKPENGLYRNVILNYEANNHTYLYSSDGVPVRLNNGITNYDEATNLPKINSVTLIGNKTSADLGLANKPLIITIDEDNTHWSGANTTKDVFDFFTNRGKVNIVFANGDNHFYEIISASYVEEENKLFATAGLAGVTSIGGASYFDGRALYGTIELLDSGKAANIGEIDFQPLLTAGDGIEINPNNVISVKNIEQYAHFFDTVADMKAATNLVAGDYARTGGFYTVNDGGGALYHIVDDNTLVEDGGSVHDLVNGLKAVALFDGEVTPEMFGAYGDGEHDDTDAWNKAVSVKRDVKAFEKTYLVGTIEVSDNINIDCGNASFITGANNLFLFTGSVNNTLSNESNYDANDSDYEITNTTYTGFAFLRGDNNFAPERDYYVGGFPALFNNGKITTSYPINVSNTSVDLITPITFSLKNIKDIQHTVSTTSVRSIVINYGYGCKLENINISASNSYIDIDVAKSLHIEMNNIKVKHEVRFNDNVSYVVYIEDSAFCKLSNSQIHNAYWHAFSTSGIYLNYNNIIDNCTLSSETGLACVDHANALGTTITNSTIVGIGLSGLSLVSNCKILSNKDEQKRCTIQIFPNAISDNAEYTIKDVTFMTDPNANGTYCGIWLSHSPYETGSTYHYKTIKIENCYKQGTLRCRACYCNLPTTSNYVIGNIYISETNLDVNYVLTTHTSVDISSAKLFINNCNTLANPSSHISIGATTAKFNELYISNSIIMRIQGTVAKLYLTNVYADSSLQNFNVTDLISGSNILTNIQDAVLLQPSNISISNMYRGSSNILFNITRRSNRVFYQYLDTTTFEYTTGEITS